MGFTESILHPKDFLGITDLKAGTLIIATINLILTITNGFGSNATTGGIATLLGIVLTVLCIIGIKKNKPGFVKAYYIYLCLCVCFSVFIAVVVILNFRLFQLILAIIYFFIILYSCCVVKTYYRQMEESAKGANSASAATANAAATV